MSGLISGFHNALIRAAKQPAETERMRIRFKKICEGTKSFAVGGGIISGALTISSLVTGGVFGGVGLAVGVTLGIFSYDNYRVSVDGVACANEPRYFQTFGNIKKGDPQRRQKIESAVRGIINEAGKNTIILRPAAICAVQIILDQKPSRLSH